MAQSLHPRELHDHEQYNGSVEGLEDTSSNAPKFEKKKPIDTKIGRLSTFFPSRLARSCLRITSFRELAPSHSRSFSLSFFHSLASFSFHPRFCHFIFHSRLSYLLIYW